MSQVNWLHVLQGNRTIPADYSDHVRRCGLKSWVKGSAGVIPRINVGSIGIKEGLSHNLKPPPDIQRGFSREVPPLSQLLIQLCIDYFFQIRIRVYKLSWHLDKLFFKKFKPWSSLKYRDLFWLVFLWRPSLIAGNKSCNGPMHVPSPGHIPTTSQPSQPWRRTINIQNFKRSSEVPPLFSHQILHQKMCRLSLKSGPNKAV